MFDSLIAPLVSYSAKVTRREEGISFFKAAKDLYRVAGISYFCIDIPAAASQKYYAHCIYSDACVMHCMSHAPVGPDMDKAGLIAPYSEPRECLQEEPECNAGAVVGARHALTFPLRQRCGECAVFGMTAEATPSGWSAQKQAISRELRILANYFHGHILRIYGHDAERDIMMTAKELDCLKWTAAGKTAWEASVILGISERTVRFHLNMAREKLNCATTTQAVAKAIVNHLIDV